MAELEPPDASRDALLAHGVTHVGCVRQTNEDSLYFDVETGVYIVADGMGGHLAGDVASRLAVDTISDFLARSRDDDSLTWPFGLDAELSSDGNRLNTAVRLANRRVFTTSETRPEQSGMGTTVVAAMVSGDLVTFCGVGDSRLYLFREGHLTQLTHDDTWIATVLAQNSDADPATLQHHPFRHMLTEAVGTVADVNVRVQEHRLQPGEALLLCSDGLHTSVSDADIERLMTGALPSGPPAACQALLDAALAAEARDNVTALVLQRR